MLKHLHDITLTKPSLFVLGALANQNVSNADFILFFIIIILLHLFWNKSFFVLFFCFTTLFFPLFILFSLFSRADVLYWLQADVHMRIYIHKIYILKDSYVYEKVKPNKKVRKQKKKRTKNVIYILEMHARGWEVISRITNGSAFFFFFLYSYIYPQM